MSIYNETMSNTSVDDLHLGENCYTCNNDCQGIILDIFREVPDWDNLTFDENQYYNDRIYELFLSKGYRNVYYSDYNCECQEPQVDMYVSHALTMVRHLKPLGYDCSIKRYATNRFRGRVLFFKNGVKVHPLELLEGGVFDMLPIRGDGK